MLGEFDTVRLQENLDAFKKNKTWYCPTHLTRRDEAYADDKNYRERYNNINPLLRFLSFEDLDATIQEDTSALGRKVFMNFYLKGLEITRKASRQGIKVLAGSDVPELPGSSLHEELVELSNAGLTPFEVLRTATLYPTRYYGLQNVYGSIEKGKTADMVILSANPVQNINNTKAIKAVIFDGKYIDESTLADLKEKVNTSGNSIVMSAKLLWDMLIYITL
jgi:imidazolonepropionase-like amidohydrolase